MIDEILNIAKTQSAPKSRADEAALRKAAMQFEAVLLQQITKSLSGTESEDGDSLYGSDGGTGLAKQMFAEQLATTLAEAGGAGLQDVILRQFGVEQTRPAGTTSLNSAASAVKAIRRDSTPVAAAKPIINRGGGIEPVNLSVGSGEAEVISTFADEVRAEGLDDTLRGLMLDGRIVNSTRPRVVPNAPVTRLDTSRVSFGSETITAPTSAETPSGPVQFRHPVSGRVSSKFGNRVHPIDGRVKFHGGLDIAVPTGTRIVAAADGVVTFAGWRGGYGNVVKLRHADGSETLYAHNSKILVSEGQRVRSGEPITLSGSTGKSTGPHLHFEIRRNGNLVNPQDFLSNVLPTPAER